MYYGKTINKQNTENVSLLTVRNYVLTSSAIPQPGILTYDNMFLDTHNAMNMLTGVYTIPVTGLYLIDFNLSTSNSDWLGWFYIRKNSIKQPEPFSSGPCASWENAGTFLLTECEQGDEITIYSEDSGTRNNYIRYGLRIKLV